jgi:linoleoyl-CoA desaturase
VKQAGSMSFARRTPQIAALKQRVHARFGQGGRRVLAGRRLALKIAFFAACGALAYAALLARLSGGELWAASAAAFAFFAASFFLVVNLGHDAFHGTLIASRGLGYRLGELCFVPLGIDGYLWRLRHVHSHHHFPNVPGCDSDIDDSVLVKISPHSPTRWFHGYQGFYALPVLLLLAVYSIFVQDLIYLFKRELANLREIRHSKAVYVQFLAAKLAYLAIWFVVPLAISGLSFASYLPVYLAAQALGSLLFVPIAMTHLNEVTAHAEVPSDGAFECCVEEYQILSSLDWATEGRMGSFFYGGLNHHMAHHLFPRISHEHYAEITPEIYAWAAEQGVALNRMGFWAGVRSFFAYLRVVGQGRFRPRPLALGQAPCGN